MPHSGCDWLQLVSVLVLAVIGPAAAAAIPTPCDVGVCGDSADIDVIVVAFDVLAPPPPPDLTDFCSCCTCSSCCCNCGSSRTSTPLALHWSSDSLVPAAVVADVAVVGCGPTCSSWSSSSSRSSCSPCSGRWPSSSCLPDGAIPLTAAEDLAVDLPCCLASATRCDTVAIWLPEVLGAWKQDRSRL